MERDMKKHNFKTIVILFGTFLIVGAFVIIVSGDGYKQYLGLSEYPNCMRVETDLETGERHTLTLTPDYQEVYSLSFETFYMNTDEKALNKYDQFYHDFDVNNIVWEKETIVSKDVKVKMIKDSQDKIRFFVKNGKTVYQASGDYTTMNKKQKWFDILRVDYQIPDIE